MRASAASPLADIAVVHFALRKLPVEAERRDDVLEAHAELDDHNEEGDAADHEGYPDLHREHAATPDDHVPARGARRVRQCVVDTVRPPSIPIR